MRKEVRTAEGPAFVPRSWSGPSAEVGLARDAKYGAPESVGRRVVASRKALTRLALVLTVIVAGFVADGAQAAIYTQCNRDLFVPYGRNGSLCPSPPNGARHTYKGGRAATGFVNGSFAHKWYVAYTSSNASTWKYRNVGYYGQALYESFGLNTQLLRGYIQPLDPAPYPGGSGPYYGEGNY